MAYYGIIFDVDGVIADTEAVNAQASIKMFADLFGLHGVCREDFAAGLGRGAEAYIQAAAKIHNLALSPDEVEKATRMRQEYFLDMLSHNPLPPFPGVLELMQTALAHPDFHLAIATSSTREKSVAVLQSARIPYQQMVYITGSDVSHKKPHPELFQKAVASLQIPPGRCVVIEDATSGVAAAKAAGCRCIGVTNTTTATNLAEADLIVSALTEVDLDTISSLCDAGHD